LRKPDIYEARARIEVDVEALNPALGTSKNSPVVLNNPVNYPTYFNTQLKILSGDGLLRRAVKTLDLEHNQDFVRYLPSQDDTFLKTALRTVSSASRKDEAKTQQEEAVPLSSSIATSASESDLREAAKLAPYVEVIQENLKVEGVKENGLTAKDTYLIDISYTHQSRQVAAKTVNAIGDIFVLSNLEKRL